MEVFVGQVAGQWRSLFSKYNKGVTQKALRVTTDAVPLFPRGDTKP